MKISIITVAYNSANTIGDTLRSVASQTHLNLEHIIIDGASKDDTLNVVKHNAHRVAKVVSEPDLGIYDAMNKGLALASGQYVGFLNADDVYATKDAIAKVALALKDNPVDIIYGDIEHVRENDLGSVVRYWKSGVFTAAALRTGWMPPHPGTFLSRKVMQEVGGFNTSYRIAGDYDLMLRCMLRPDLRISYLPILLTKQRTGGASTRSLAALVRKSTEDLRVIRRNQIGGAWTLFCKNVRKVSQFIV